MQQKLLTIIADILEISVTELSADSEPENTPNWNSLAHMNIVFAVEDEFGISIDEQNLEKSMSVKGLLELINCN
jgi:acyl carrier protein